MLFDNPIWFRERQAGRVRALRRPLLERARALTLTMIWVLVTALILMVDFASRRCWSSSELRDGIEVAVICGCYVQVAYLTFRALVSGAVAFARERELQTMDTLLASPLPAETLLTGKWLVAAWPLVVEILLALPLQLLMSLAFLGELGGYRYNPLVQPAQVGNLFVISVVLVLLGTAVGLLCSSRARNSGRAAMQAVAVGLVLTLGCFMIDVVISAFTRAHVVHPVLNWINPFAALYSAITNLPLQDDYASPFWAETVGIYLTLTPLVVWQALRRLRRSM